jgi:hypothetical protein
LTWATPLESVKEGIDSAESAQEPCQVWVAKGIYYIYESSPKDTVQLKSNIGLFGGFAGTETSLEQRDWFENETVLHAGKGRQEGERVSNVVTCDIPAGGVREIDTEINGFTITGGRAFARRRPARVCIWPAVRSG